MDDKEYIERIAVVYCPFYISDQGKSIICEGMFGGKTKNSFKDKKVKQMHKSKYCISERCKKCDLYKMVLRRYEAKE